MPLLTIYFELTLAVSAELSLEWLAIWFSQNHAAFLAFLRCLRGFDAAHRHVQLYTRFEIVLTSSALASDREWRFITSELVP